MTKLVLIVFLILTLASIFMYIGLYLQSVNSYNDFNALKSIRSFFAQNETYFRCSPFKLNFKPYRVKIDNNTYPRSLPLHLNDSIDFNCLNQSSDIKKILFWNSFFGQSSYGYEVGKIYPFVNKNCPVTSCELTVDKNRVNESDLVLVHLRDGYSQFPSYRPNDQRWVFVLYESPVHSGDFTNLKGFFNMTSTYHLDSDFPDFYSTFSGLTWKRNYNFDENKDYLKNKTDFAAAIISNCGGTSGRLNYIRELQNYITVNVYGKCGKACPAEASYNKNITNCKEIISYQYKFYFAFENSVCKDYVTEKFFEILRYPIIPVVLGGGKYEHFVSKFNLLSTLLN
jgi:alpha-1,3-fucosyltransferase